MNRVQREGRLRYNVFLLKIETDSAKKEESYPPHLWPVENLTNSNCNKKKLLRPLEELFYMVNIAEHEEVNLPPIIRR